MLDKDEDIVLTQFLKEVMEKEMILPKDPKERQYLVTQVLPHVIPGIHLLVFESE